MAIAAFTLGICSLIALIVPIVGIPVCLACLIVSGIAFARKRSRFISGFGIIVGAICMVLSLMNAVLGWVMWSPEFWQWMDLFKGI